MQHGYPNTYISLGSTPGPLSCTVNNTAQRQQQKDCWTTQCTALALQHSTLQSAAVFLHGSGALPTRATPKQQHHTTGRESLIPEHQGDSQQSSWH